MSDYLIEAIDPAELAAVRADGRDRQGHRVSVKVDDQGGEQLRCCLTRSEPGEPVMLIAHAPLQADSPWQEVGPVFVHAQDCPGRAASSELPDWFDDGPRVLRAYTSGGTMHYAANRVVEAGDGIAAGLEQMFGDPLVAEVHVRNMVEQCFIARAVRTA